MSDILVVADEPWVLNDVRAALGEARYKIAETSDPRSVAETVTSDEPDAVLVDLQVGSMGGMAVTRAVRDAFAGSGRAAPPVILLLDRDAHAFLAGRSGAAAWGGKPFSAGGPPPSTAKSRLDGRRWRGSVPPAHRHDRRRRAGSAPCPSTTRLRGRPR